MVNNNRASIKIYNDQSTINTYITCDDDGNIYGLSVYSFGNFTARNVSDTGYEAMYVRCDDSHNTAYTKLCQWDYTNREWTTVVSGNRINYFYGDASIENNIAVIASNNNLSGSNYYCGNYLIWYRNDNQDTITSYFTNMFPLASTVGSGSGDSGESNPSYNDNSFKSLVSELFDHLFDILLYGEDEDYDGTDVDDSIEWLDDLSEDMEDITDKLNQAPTYISNGFTAINNAQTGINDFFTGISTAVPVLYYGIVGILNIIIIRKIIGR